MTQQIIELSRREEKTIRTNCLFTFEDGSTKEIEVSHFCPKDEAEIELGLSNRLISEQRKINEEKDIKVDLEEVIK